MEGVDGIARAGISVRASGAPVSSSLPVSSNLSVSGSATTPSLTGRPKPGACASPGGGTGIGLSPSTGDLSAAVSLCGVSGVVGASTASGRLAGSLAKEGCASGTGAVPRAGPSPDGSGSTIGSCSTGSLGPLPNSLLSGSGTRAVSGLERAGSRGSGAPAGGGAISDSAPSDRAETMTPAPTPPPIPPMMLPNLLFAIVPPAHILPAVRLRGFKTCRDPVMIRTSAAHRLGQRWPGGRHSQGRHLAGARPAPPKHSCALRYCPNPSGLDPTPLLGPCIARQNARIIP